MEETDGGTTTESQSSLNYSVVKPSTKIVDAIPTLRLRARQHSLATGS